MQSLDFTDAPKSHDVPGHGGPSGAEPRGQFETGGAVASSAREGSSGGQQGLVD